MAIRSLKSGIFSRSAMVGNTLIYPGSYDSIATTTVGAGGTTSITFSSIPQTYTHLQLRMLTIGNGSNTASGFMALNCDSTSTNYYTHYLYGNGATAAAGANQTNYEQNKCKWVAANNFCINLGWNFVVLTEVGLGKLKTKIKKQQVRFLNEQDD